MRKAFVVSVLSLLLWSSGRLLGAGLIPNPGINGPAGENSCPPGWTTWFPRENLAPRFYFDPATGRNAPGSLVLEAIGLPYTIGRWQSTVTGISPGRTYSFRLWYRAEGLKAPERSLRINLRWLGKDGQDVASDYVAVPVGGRSWTKVERTVESPEGATTLRIELYIRGGGIGRIWLDDLELVPVEPRPHRVIRVGTIWVKPWENGTPESNVDRFCEWLTKAGEAGCDLVCLPEAITSFCVPREKRVLVPVPGWVTDKIGKVARRYKMHVVACFDELLNGKGYNTAVWIDRQGRVRGKYHKTHLPFTEFERGLVPGDNYPTFQTDFGVIGMEICYDDFFPEVARSLALNGAEIILLPIWGDERAKGYIWDIIARARAIDNGVYLVACKYSGGRSLIVDPEGKILADTQGKEGLITADIDLDKRFLTPYLSVRGLGEWRKMFPVERRPETYGTLTR